MTTPLMLCAVVSYLKANDGAFSPLKSKNNKLKFLCLAVFNLIKINFTKAPKLPCELIKKIICCPRLKNKKEAITYLGNIASISKETADLMTDAKIHVQNFGYLTLNAFPNTEDLSNALMFINSHSHKFTSLDLRSYNNVLPETIQEIEKSCPNLKRIYLNSNLIVFFSQIKITSIEHVHLTGCNKMQSFYFENCNVAPITIKTLDIDALPQLRCLCSFIPFINLQRLSISNCPELKMLPSMASLKNLTYLKLVNLQINKLEPRNLSALRTLTVIKCHNITEIALKGLTSLKKLDIRNCLKISRCPSINSLTSLNKLSILECPRLDLDQDKDDAFYSLALIFSFFN